MKFEKAWTESIQKDLKGITAEGFDKLNSEIDKILDNPNIKTKRIKNWQGNVRRLRFNDYRLILLVSEKNLTIYILAFLPRKDCYSDQTKKIIEKLVMSIEYPK